VSVRLSLLDGMAQVDVNDDGIGIVEKDQERIFERFFRGEDPLVLQKAGTGLGLAISKILIEMHGGKIWFSSAGKKGEGSTFSFTIPVELREE
jgi:signal transduction histidine kinase